MNTRRMLILASIVILVSPFVAAQAAPPENILGTWSLTCDAFLGQNNETAGQVAATCRFTGTAVVTEQNNGAFKGTASLTLVPPGGQGCPAEMSARIEGTVVGTSVNMGMLIGGDLGTGTFTGQITRPQAARSDVGNTGSGKPKAAAHMIAGGFNIQAGPFAGAHGNWAAAIQMALANVPTLSAVGLALLAALLAAAGWAALKKVKTA